VSDPGQVIPGPCCFLRSSALTEDVVGAFRRFVASPVESDSLVQGNLKVCCALLQNDALLTAYTGVLLRIFAILYFAEYGRPSALHGAPFDWFFIARGMGDAMCPIRYFLYGERRVARGTRSSAPVRLRSSPLQNLTDGPPD
jgi:hypothetical protein